jgi:hypothetical protein
MLSFAEQALANSGEARVTSFVQAGVPLSTSFASANRSQPTFVNGLPWCSPLRGLHEAAPAARSGYISATFACFALAQSRQRFGRALAPKGQLTFATLRSKGGSGATRHFLSKPKAEQEGGASRNEPRRLGCLRQPKGPVRPGLVGPWKAE